MSSYVSTVFKPIVKWSYATIIAGHAMYAIDISSSIGDQQEVQCGFLDDPYIYMFRGYRRKPAYIAQSITQGIVAPITYPMKWMASERKMIKTQTIFYDSNEHTPSHHPEEEVEE